MHNRKIGCGGLCETNNHWSLTILNFISVARNRYQYVQCRAQTMDAFSIYMS